VSYAIGADLANKLKTAQIDVDPTVLTRALKEGLTGGKPAMTDDEVHSTLVDLSSRCRPNSRPPIRSRRSKQGAGREESEDGDAFLAQNKEEGSHTAERTAVQDSQGGDGPKPTASDTVSCNYRGTLI